MNRAISILVHGHAKTGKTTFAATAPAPRLLLDCESGSRFLNIVPVSWDPNRNAPPEYDGSWDTCIVTVRHYDDMIKAYQWLQAGKHPFASVIVDSISELQQKLVEKVTNRMQAQQQDWGDILRQFMGAMRDFRDLTENPIKPLNAVILVAMSVAGQDGKYRPFAQGQSKIMLPYLYDLTAATDKLTWVDEHGNQQVLHRLMFQSAQYETGERVGGRIGPFMDNATVPAILDLIYGPESVPVVTGTVESPA